MQAALRITTTVHPGGKIEVTDPQLPTGEAVEVIVLFPEALGTPRRSIVDVLEQAPGHLLFHTAEDAESYLHAERDSWEDQLIPRAAISPAPA